MSEHKMACADGRWRSLVHVHCESDISLFEIVFSYTLHLLKNVTNFEISGSLGEGALTDVVDLLEIEDAVQDSFGLVESLLRNALPLSVQMAVKLLQVDEGDFAGLLNLAHNLLSEVVEVFFGVHELLEVDHGVEVTHHK